MEIDETIEGPSHSRVPATVILINIFNPSTLNTAEVAHVATCRLIRRYLRLSSPQYVAVCLYGAEDSTSTILDQKFFTELITLSLPGLEDYKKLKNTDLTKINKAEELIMSDVLWHCSKMFANFKHQFTFRTIIMLTRLDIPPAETDLDRTLTRLVDLVNSNIEFKIINIAPVGYEIDPFYYGFLMLINKANYVILPKTIWDPIQIGHLMAAESYRHSVIAQFNFEIGNGVSIGVSLYKLLRIGVFAFQYEYVKRQTNLVATSVPKTKKTMSNVTENLDSDQRETQETRLKPEIHYYQQYGSERITVTNEEMKIIQNPIQTPMLKLLGFKPAANLCKEKWFFKESYFLFPNEALLVGSTVAFKALHQACSEMGKIAICVMSSQVNAKPIIVALSPCSHPLGLDVEIGFDVICLPFLENIRDLSFVEQKITNKTPKKCKQLMRDIFSDLIFDYRPDMFENPKLQSQYRAIEAKALAEDDIGPFIDTTKPNFDNFQNINNELFYGLLEPGSAVATKRVAPIETIPCSNRERVEDINEDINEDLLKDRISSSEIYKYTVTELKQILRFKNVPETLSNVKKGELIHLVYDYCTEMPKRKKPKVRKRK